jgi:hypothetical protein
MRDTRIYDAITTDQNRGIKCPSCRSLSGHYQHCRVFSPAVFVDHTEPVALESLSISEVYNTLLKVMGIKWELYT